MNSHLVPTFSNIYKLANRKKQKINCMQKASNKSVVKKNAI